MNRRGGWTLVEALVYMAIVSVVLGLLGVLMSDLLMRHSILAQVENEIDVAGRFLHDVKGDLRRASKVEIDPEALALSFPEGAGVSYRFLKDEGTIVRSEGGREGAYPMFCESLRFERGTAGAVFVTTELMNPDPASTFRPVWRAMAVPRNLEK